MSTSTQNGPSSLSNGQIGTGLNAETDSSNQTFVAAISKLNIAPHSLAAVNLDEHPSDGGDRGNTPDSLTPQAPSAIENLPVELLLMISRKLSPECRACLALTSRAMLAAHGTCVLNLSREHGHRIGFLRLLEKKGALPSHILCPYCSVFHRPVMPTLWISGGPKRLHYKAPGGRRRCEQKAASLSCDVSFSTVAAIARSARLSLGVFPPTILNTCVRHGPEDGNRPLIRVYTSCKVVDGHVLLRTRTCLYSRSSGIHALKATARLRGILNRSHGALRKICRHRRWTETYNFILPEPNKTTGQFAEAKQVCLWSHPLGCLKQECGILPYSLSASQVCRVCPTSYLAEKKDVLGPSGHSRQRAVVVTTWHDLGAGMNEHDPEWALSVGWSVVWPPSIEYNAQDGAIQAQSKFEKEH